MENKISRKGQVGETLTWIIATIVIVVVLLFFIFGASMLGSTKSIGTVKSSLFSSSQEYGEDIFLKKSVYTYLMASSDATKKRIELYFDETYGDNYLDELSKIRKRYNKE